MASVDQMLRARERILSGDKQFARSLMESAGGPGDLFDQVAQSLPQASWYTGDDWSDRDKEVNAAYWLIFGYEADPSAIAEGRQSELSSQGWLMQLSATPEAINMGVNPEWFGNEKLDPADLSAEEREYYDVWAAANPGQDFYTADKNFLDWSMDGMSIDAFRAQQEGLITTQTNYSPETGSLFNYQVVSEDAVKSMGGDLTGLYGNRQGDVYLAPAGLGSTDQLRGGDALTEGDYAGMSFYQATGNLSSGFGDFVGDITGSDDLGDLAGEALTIGAVATPMTASSALGGTVLQEAGIDEGVLLVDPLNMITPLAQGELAAIENQEKLTEAADTFGLEADEFAELQGHTRTGVGIVLAAVNPFAGAAYATVSNASAAQMGYMDWDDAAINSGVSLAGAYLFTGPLQGASPFAQASAQAGLTTGAELARGEDFESAVEEGAWAGARTLAADFAGDAVAGWLDVGDYTANFIGSVASGSVLDAAREEFDSEYEAVDFGDRLWQSALSAGASTAMKGNSKTKRSWKTWRPFDRPARTEFGAEPAAQFGTGMAVS